MNQYSLELFGPQTSVELAAGMGGLAFALDHYARQGKAFKGGSVTVENESITFEWEDTGAFFSEIIEFLHYTIQDNDTPSGLLEWAPLMSQSLESRLAFQRALENTLHTHPRHDRKQDKTKVRTLYSKEELADLGLKDSQNKEWKEFQELTAKNKVISAFRSAMTWDKERISNSKARGKGIHWSASQHYSSSLVPNCPQLYAPVKGDVKNSVRADAFQTLAYLHIALGAYPFVVAPNHGALVVPVVLDLHDFVKSRRVAASQPYRINYKARTVEDAVLRVGLVVRESGSGWEMPAYVALYLSRGNTMDRVESLRSYQNDKDDMIQRYSRIENVSEWLRSLAARDIVLGRPMYRQIGERIVQRSGVFTVREDRTPKEKARYIADPKKNPEWRLMMEAVLQEMAPEEQLLQEYVSACIRRAYGRGYSKGGDDDSGGKYAFSNRDAIYRRIKRAGSKETFAHAMCDIAQGSAVLPREKQAVLWNFLNADWKRAKSLALFCFGFYEPKEEPPSEDSREESL